MASTASLWPATTTFPSSSTYPGHGAIGDKIYPAATLFPGSSTFPGQGAQPMHELLMSFDDASDPTPTWSYVTGSLRSFSIVRGRENELATVDAGTETLTMDNRDRAFDPTYGAGPYYPNLRPMNRLWHRVRFAGETHDLFKGYVDAYEQQWPGKVDAVTVVHASDEFKVLALGNLPTTDPPRNTYTDVVQYDKPQAYWRMNNESATLSQAAVIGPELTSPGGMSATTDGAIVGEQSDDTWNAGGLTSSAYMIASDLAPGQTPEMGNLSEMTVEAWFFGATFANQQVVTGPYVADNVNRQYAIAMTVSGVFSFTARNGTGSVTATATSTTTPGQWTHVAGTVEGSTINIYINGLLRGTAAWSGTISAASTTAGFSYFALGGVTLASNPMFFDEVAAYRYGLDAGRVLAHYNAGVNCGFAAGHTTGQRVGAVLDAATSQAPRSVDIGVRTMQGRYMVGQDALGEIRVAEKAEAVDAMVFVNRHGGITFLDSAYRGTAAYIAPAITFSDDGRFLPYVDIAVDYSEAYLANEWNVTFTGGTTVTSSDATSVSRYYRRSQSLPDLAVRGTGADQVIADAMLAKYKEPMLRITSLSPKMNDTDILEQIFSRDLGDRIRVIRTPIEGQAAIDQQLFIQKIEISGTGQSPYLTVAFGVSPV